MESLLGILSSSRSTNANIDYRYFAVVHVIISVARLRALPTLATMARILAITFVSRFPYFRVSRFPFRRSKFLEVTREYNIMPGL